MKSKEILTIFALIFLGLCLLLNLGNKSSLQKLGDSSVFIAIVLLAVGQLLGETEKFDSGIGVVESQGERKNYIPTHLMKNLCNLSGKSTIPRPSTAADPHPPTQRIAKDQRHNDTKGQCSPYETPDTFSPVCACSTKEDCENAICLPWEKNCKQNANCLTGD